MQIAGASKRSFLSTKSISLIVLHNLHLSPPSLNTGLKSSIVSVAIFDYFVLYLVKSIFLTFSVFLLDSDILLPVKLPLITGLVFGIVTVWAMPTASYCISDHLEVKFLSLHLIVWTFIDMPFMPLVTISALPES